MQFDNDMSSHFTPATAGFELNYTKPDSSVTFLFHWLMYAILFQHRKFNTQFHWSSKIENQRTQLTLQSKKKKTSSTSFSLICNTSVDLTQGKKSTKICRILEPHIISCVRWPKYIFISESNSHFTGRYCTCLVRLNSLNSKIVFGQLLYEVLD
jgi:hypothetical protein